MAPNPLDMVTRNEDDPTMGVGPVIPDADGVRRVYINTPGVENRNALTPVTGPAASQQEQWSMDDLFKGLAALKEYVGGNVAPVNDMVKRFTNYDRQLTEDALSLPGKIWNNPGKANEVGQRLLGGENWLSNMVTNATTAPGRAAASDVPITSEQMIAPAQDIAGMATGSMLFGKPGAGTLGSGPLRPGAKAVPTEPAPVFYSALEHAATNAAQDVMSPQQWLGFLKNQPGVKAEELAWTGLPEWLQSQKGKVKKEDVKAYLDEHKVEIKDVTKSDQFAPGEMQEAIDRRIESLSDDFAETEGRNPTNHEIDAMQRQAREEVMEDPEAFGAERGDKGVKYSSYQLPGGENYREHLLTMSARGVTPEQFAAAQAAERKAGNAYDRFQTKIIDEKYGSTTNFEEKATPAEKTQFQELREAALKASDDLLAAKAGKDKRDSYHGSHWDEPNVLAHVRTNDRYMPSEAGTTQTIKRGSEAINREIDQLNADLNDGKVAGKDYLPKSKALMEELNAARDKEASGQPVESRDIKGKKSLHIEEIQSDWHQQGRKQGYKESNRDFQKEIEAKDADATNAYRAWQNTSPNLPEKVAQRKAEHEQLQREANALRKERDATRLAVPDAPFKTTWPELALKRMIRHAAENGYERISWTPGEAQAARYDLSKQIKALHYIKTEKGEYLLGPETHTGQEAPINQGQPVKADKLADYVGKDVADKIIKGEGKQGLGKDTKVLEGLDLKVGGEGMREFYDKMLPKMAEKIGKAHGVKVKQTSLGEPEYHVGGHGDRHTVYKSTPDGGEVAQGIFKTRAEADEFIKSAPKTGAPVHYFDLPESLRHHAVGKGFPLYMSGVPFPLTPVDHDPFAKKKDK